MNAEQQFGSQTRAARQFPARPLRPRRQRLVCLSAVLLAFCLTCELRSETPSAVDFPELASAYRPISDFVVENTILIGKGDTAATPDIERSCDPFPAESRILSYEENTHFILATGDASHILAPSQQAEDKPAFVRRFLFLKPSVFVVDDVVRQPGSDSSVRWLLRSRSAPTAADRRLRFTNGDRELVYETLWPVTESLQSTSGSRKAAESVYQIEAVPEAGAKEVRLLHVFHLRKAGDDGGSVKSVLENNDGVFELAISAPHQVFRLTLPPPGGGAGRIAIEAADGETVIASRPLPSGVLPHGPEGVRLIERWDSAYRDGRRPGWDTGLPAEDLKKVVEEGVVRPCRTVVVGCGSGTNAIYLAEKGFDVTAIDVAPTALGIARAKAEKAGVRVRWVLADVLALPELEPFDFLFDRGCYHNVRYVDAPGFVESVRRLSSRRCPGTRCLILSLNREGPPGVLESHMRDDFSSGFDFEWLRKSDIQTGDEGKNRRASWSLMLRRKEGD